MSDEHEFHVEGDRRPSSATMLGRLALGAITHTARTTLHEMMHQEFPGDHCDLGCCQQRIALRWQCRTFAMLGLYVADPDSGVDASLAGRSLKYQSTCRQQALFGSPAANFSGSCAMNAPGVQGDEEAWSGRSAWSNPTGCP